MISCSLSNNLPDIRTDQQIEVSLPPELEKKWKKEGRYEIEIAELDIFFTKTGLKRTPVNYIIKWLTDYVRELGIDGYRVDSVNRVEEEYWQVLADQAENAFKEWKLRNPKKVLDQTPFLMLGAASGYGIDSKRFYKFQDRKVDYFAFGFDHMVNYQFKRDAAELPYDELFKKYSTGLQTHLFGKGVMNYISSHEDKQPFDQYRLTPFDAGTKLLLTPGISQIYYGDEIARPLFIQDIQGLETLRSAVDWQSITQEKTQSILEHWQKLGTFRRDHPSIGAGRHQQLSAFPYVFSRLLDRSGVHDLVVVGLDLPKGQKTLSVGSTFKNNTILVDRYSGQEVTVLNQKVQLNTAYT
ncbi:MAG: alpha-amylase family glycosyl hydrolase, partial [Bacteroidota bacterium]